MIKVAIGGKSETLLKHLTEDPPASDNQKWNQDDLVIFCSGKDKLQTFDLHVKANNIKQEGKSIDDLWLKLQGIWGEIETRDPNPMEHPNDIIKYNNIRSKQKLFQFLNALDHKHDNIKRELLRIEPLPTVEAAYATIRKENAYQNIFNNKIESTNHSGIASGLIAPASKTKETDGHGLYSKNQRTSNYLSSKDKDNLVCEECGMKRHTKDQCFRRVGYPEWWNDGYKKGKASMAAGMTATRGNQETTNSGTTTAQGGFGLMAAKKPASSSPGGDKLGLGLGFTFKPVQYSDGEETENMSFSTNDVSFANVMSNKIKNEEWIIDCGATDTMTFDKTDFYLELKPNKTQIKTANGGSVQVKGGGAIEISPTLKLKNFLYVPTLSHKLLSVSHVIKELNCTILLHPTFCILQDIRTGKIIGRGTELDGLYYVDEVTQDDTIMLDHGTPNRQAWLWHRRLGHPSAGYLKILFPNLFSNKVIDVKLVFWLKAIKTHLKLVILNLITLLPWFILMYGDPQG
ncbi:uncharacterized protein [Rutidosis leptorrhynchoides]|uniref:uncharacterized protein n=1 Tax=Rutidosis leptorrhynchoides TaxID=125765 RepID=UPI003A99BA8E